MSVLQQSLDPLIKNSMHNIANNQPFNSGRLKRVQQQLRIENDILLKSGRPVLPSSLRKTIVAEYCDIAHFGTDKIYSLLRQRFYWPNLLSYIQSFPANYQVCQNRSVIQRLQRPLGTDIYPLRANAASISRHC